MHLSSAIHATAMNWPLDQIPPDVIEALKSGNKIQAIKALRRLKGLGLAEAKALVEEFARRNPDVARAAKAAKARMPQPPPDAPAHRDAPHAFAPAEPVYRATGLAPGEVPRSNASLFLVVLLIVAAVTVYYFLGET